MGAHLGREYSMEGLLAIVEFTQYQSYAVSNFSDYLSAKYDYKANIVELPPDIPKSLIVYGSNGKSPPSPSMVRNGNGSSPKHSGSQLQLAISTKTPHPQTPNCAVTPSPSAEQRYNYSNSVALNLS